MVNWGDIARQVILEDNGNDEQEKASVQGEQEVDTLTELSDRIADAERSLRCHVAVPGQIVPGSAMTVGIHLCAIQQVMYADGFQGGRRKAKRKLSDLGGGFLTSRHAMRLLNERIEKDTAKENEQEEQAVLHRHLVNGLIRQGLLTAGAAIPKRVTMPQCAALAQKLGLRDQLKAYQKKKEKMIFLKQQLDRQSNNTE